MSKIALSRFEIDAYVKGDPDSSKLALCLPGLLDSKDYPHMRSHVDFLAEQGFHALAVDFPGTWGSSGSISDFTVTNCLQVIDELIRKFNRPTLLIGHSNGARLALHAAAQHSLAVAVAAIMPPLHVFDGSEDSEDMQTWRRTRIKISLRDDPHNHNPDTQKRFELPFSFVEDSATYKLTDVLGHITAPKLFIAGQRDSLIPVDEVKKTYDLAAGPKQFATVDSAHNYRKVPGAIKEINARILELVEPFSYTPQ